MARLARALPTTGFGSRFAFYLSCGAVATTTAIILTTEETLKPALRKPFTLRRGGKAQQRTPNPLSPPPTNWHTHIQALLGVHPTTRTSKPSLACTIDVCATALCDDQPTHLPTCCSFSGTALGCAA